MISYRRVRVLYAILFAATAIACATIPNPPLADCGRFGFTPSTDTNSTGQAALFELTYTHVPRNCPISCGNYWFVQALRPLNTDTGEFLQPYDTQQDRMVKGQTDEYFNGWAIDRRKDRRLGWYGVTDDFKFEPPSGIPGEVFQIGNASVPAMMHDTLARGDRWAGKRMQIIGITIVAGLDPGTPCENKILGVQKWMVVFSYDEATKKNTVAMPTLLDSGQRDVQAFLLAVDEWNKHLNDGRVRLPWAEGSGFSLP